ncbi:hypothetical protein [Oceanobacillus salinisoli]|uniref:hypothetical protein n=1 Tax=Oceanobacillus salinisoli TaxID=2678611 RepID=UPI0012E2E80E|nr:hypothetical protein [Oceanobacillus salinisoli]
MNKIYCNNGCQQEFTISGLKIEKLSGNVERHYIECPHCGEKYTSYYLNDTMKKVQQEIKALQKKPSLKIKQRNRLLKLKRKMQMMNQTLKAKMEAGTSETH